LLEKVSPQLRGITNRFRAMFGVTKPYDVINAWKPFNIRELAPKMECPLLLLVGEAEYAQTNEAVAMSMLRFMNEVKSQISIHQFPYTDGWAASHCQIGALAQSQATIFEWLENTINAKDKFKENEIAFDWSLINKYLHSKELLAIQKTSKILKA